MGTLVDKGITYSVDGVDSAEVEDDLGVIREELHCTAVTLIGSRAEVLIPAADVALRHGLHVYLRLQIPGASSRELVANIRAVAAGAEALLQDFPKRVTLLLGTELSLTSRVVVPVASELLRLQLILRLGRLLERRTTRRVNELLRKLNSAARSEFSGTVTYAAAYWESVDWSDMDVVGVNLYRMGDDSPAYEKRVRELVATAGKPVVITEFGCGAHVGGDRRGPGSFLIVNWFSDPPRVRDGHVRDESVQADYLGELIDLYGAAGVHGCFVFTFFMPDFPYAADPRYDVDMAGFGVVRTSNAPGRRWVLKRAFNAVAERYA